MRRRKRKMGLVPTAHLGGGIAICHDSGRNCLRSIFILTVMCVTILQAAHLVNPSTQIINAAAAAAGNNRTATDHLYDEPDFQLEFVNLKRLQVSPSTIASEMISVSQNEDRPPPGQLTTIKPQDQLEQPSDGEASSQHLDDLLAVESNRSPVAVGQSQLKQHHGFVAPYEASGVLPKFQNLSSTPTIRHQDNNTQNSINKSSQLISDNNPTQLLRLQAYAPIEPIYLKHNLPDLSQPPLKRQGQIVAFPHPSHTSAPGGFAGAQPQGSYALLPSWPNIYIAQRERTLAPVAPTSSPLLLPHQEPKVPSNYPEWSLSLARQRGDIENEATRRDGAQQVEEARKRTNLTASEVEYSERQEDENRESGKSKQKSISTNQNVKKENHENNKNDDNNNTTTASADSAQWARLLHQAATSKHPIRPLMFTNRSIISLFCDTHDMLISLKFKQAFYGSVETNLDPLHQCRMFGNGSQLYEMRISLLDCGTRQEMPRLFINNIHIQFRSNNSKQQRQKAHIEDLEQEARRAKLSSVEQLQLRELVDSRTDDSVHDELKTLVCSYPPASKLLQPPAGEASESASNSQVNAASDNLNFENDLTQFSRPYSIAFSGGRGPRGRTDRFHNNSTTSDDLEISNNRDDFGRPLRQSDRTIDITSVDDPTSARSVYYEPILLISGLLLMAIACTLALISSAYLARQRAQQRPRTSTSNRLSPSGAGTIEDRVYRISPSQLANRSGGSPMHHNLVTPPPLIGLTKEELLTKRPSGKKYSNISRELLKVSAKSPFGTSTEHQLTRGSIARKLSPATAVQQHASQSSDGTSDSLASSGSRSVPTVEIPLASAGATSKNPSHRATGSSRGNERHPNTADGSPPPTSSGKRVGSTAAQKLPDATRREEYRREVSHERIVEKATSYSRRPAGSTPEQPAKNKTQQSGSLARTSDEQLHLGQKQQQPKKSESPLPFGSFRSKLTSPIEYMRLQNISKLFGDSLTPARDDVLHLKYRNRIARTMGDHERLNMRKLFQHDEVFKSNVVDSIDAETFWRKLRDNPKYAGKFSPATWSMLQEIVLNPDLARLPSTGSRLPRSESKKLDKLFLAPSPVFDVSGETTLKSTRGKLPAYYSRGQPKVTNLDESKLWRPGEDNAGKQKSSITRQTPLKPLLGLQLARNETESQDDSSTRKADQAATSKAHPADERLKIESGDEKMFINQNQDQHTATKTTGVCISQSNSARTRRDDGSTMINIDSITNISTPKNFSAFTRSSFKQVTRYQEEDSLPYMDELSTQSSLDQDQRSFSSSSLAGTTSKSRRR